MNEYSLIDGNFVWELHATHGFPIEVSFIILNARKQIPTWEPLLRAARRDGTNLRRLIDRIIGAMKDAGYPKHIGDRMEEMLPLMIQYMEIKDEVG